MNPRVWYFPAGHVGRHEAPDDESYHYDLFMGPADVVVYKGDCVYWLDLPHTARLDVGPTVVKSDAFAVVIRGFKPEPATARFGCKLPVLPYVNGCSTSELFRPPRLGDPTLQRLLIPGGSSEQAHHIHSTSRIVYVLRGRGVSVVGMDSPTRTDLLPGMVCVLQPMVPHHFETPGGEPLEVLPLHVWSSTSGESNHPMFRGTHLTNQGE